MQHTPTYAHTHKIQHNHNNAHIRQSYIQVHTAHESIAIKTTEIIHYGISTFKKLIEEDKDYVYIIDKLSKINHDVN